jgi:hypothetical protein
MRRTLTLALAVPLALTLLTAGAADDVGARPVAASDVAREASSIPPRPTPPSALAPADDRVNESSSADAEGTIERPLDADHAAVTPTPPDGPVERGRPVEATFLVASVPEGGAVAGSGNRWRYSIEVEPALGIDPDELALEIRAALEDERSWARTRTLEQVGDPSQARIRIVVATPDTVDALCGRAGLRTAGIYSCWNGRFAALNGWRWEVGADGFPDISTYRTYLVNHEFGHGLGYGHVGCPAEGAAAPVMMQQSKGLGRCIANGWPYP